MRSFINCVGFRISKGQRQRPGRESKYSGLRVARNLSTMLYEGIA